MKFSFLRIIPYLHAYVNWFVCLVCAQSLNHLSPLSSKCLVRRRAIHYASYILYLELV